MAMYKMKKNKKYRRRRSSSRYSSDYRHRKSTKRWSAVIIALTLTALFALGVFVIGPVLDNFIPASSENVSSQTESKENSSEMSSYEGEIPSDDTSSVTSDIPAEKKGSVACFLTPEEFITEAAIENSIEKAINEGADTLILELKGYDGLLNYQSDIEDVKSIDAVSENAVDLSVVIEKITAEGLKCGASITVFDEIYTAAHLRETAIKYDDSDTTRWLDYTRESKTPWQDPGLEAARVYELDIIRELSQYELSVINLTGCHYPVWGSMTGCSYDKTNTKVENITSFISDARGIANSADIRLTVTLSADIAVGDTHSRYSYYGYPEDIYSLDCDGIVFDLRLDNIITQYYPSITVEGSKYSDLTSDREMSLRLLYGAAASLAGENDITVLCDSVGSTSKDVTDLFEGLGEEEIICQAG